MEDRTYKYDVFISYSHADLDNAVAGYLQKALERYRIPREIQKKTGKKKISRVFRDKEELSVAADLEKEIREQIEQSEYLIVVCTSSAVQSEWVTKEINTFLESHDRTRVIPVLAEGNPQTSFPAPLLDQYEHGAADIKGESKKTVLKNAKRELPRIVAPLLGCSYAELVQRQKVYQTRKAVAVVSSIAILSTAVGSGALIQRSRIKENYWNSLLNQTKYLVREAKLQLQDDQSILALQLALAALPSKDLDRPVTAEAEHVLMQSLYAYYPPGGVYTANTWQYSANNTIEEFYISEDQSLLFARDASNTVYIWNLLEDHKCVFSQQYDKRWFDDVGMLPMGNDLLLRTESMLICVNGKTGKTKWELNTSELNLSSLIIEGGEYLKGQDKVILHTYDSLLIITCENGEIEEEIELEKNEDAEYMHDSFSPKKVRASETGDLLAIDALIDTNLHTVLLYSMKSHDYKATGLEYYEITDLCVADDRVLVSGFTEYEYLTGPADSDSFLKQKSLTCAVDAGTGKTLWENHSDIYQPVDKTNLLVSDIVCDDGTKRKVVSRTCSNVVQFLDFTNGEVMASYETDSPIISLKDIWDDNRFCFILENGKQTVMSADNSMDKEHNEFVMRDQYTKDIKDAVAFHQGTDEYELVLKNDSSAILFYEDFYYDSNLKMIDSGIYSEYYIDDSLILGNYACLLRYEYDDSFESELMILDLDKKKVIHHIPLPESPREYKMILDPKDPGNVYLVHVFKQEKDDQGIELTGVELDSGEKKVHKISVDKEEYISQTFLNCVMADNRFLYFFSDSHKKKKIFSSYDLKNGKTSDQIIPESIANEMDEDSEVSTWFNENATQALIMLSAYGTETVEYMLMDLSTEEVTQIDLPFGPSQIIWNENGSFCGTVDHGNLNLWDSTTKKTKTITNTGQIVEHAVFHENKVYYLTDTHELYCYDIAEDRITGQTDLAVELYGEKDHEQWLFRDDELVITRNGETHIIDLSEMQEKTTVYYSEGYCPDEDMFIISLFDIQTDKQILGYYERYSLDELIAMGNERVKNNPMDEKLKSQYGIS